MQNKALDQIVKKIDQQQPLNRADLIALLRANAPQQTDRLLQKAYEIKAREVGKRVYFRGIIEVSNICSKDCYYCGIRKSNRKAKRYNMPDADILARAEWAWKNQYGSVVLQSGERSDSRFIDRIESLCDRIKSLSKGELGITLSLGEQSAKTYERWFNAGAHRYLLRIETSNPRLYKKIHPHSSDMKSRIECLQRLRDSGYQVGSGVMIGLPGQSAEDLADDILFYRQHDIDMIGMGPYIVHDQTPMAAVADNIDADQQLYKALKMIAATRIYLRDINIAATTALQALRSNGREMGLLAGANVIMPNITHSKYRHCYQLYRNKPGINEDSSLTKQVLEKQIKKLDESIGYNEWGDSPHFFKKEGTLI